MSSQDRGRQRLEEGQMATEAEGPEEAWTAGSREAWGGFSSRGAQPSPTLTLTQRY